jgi:hypothetical protein
MLKKVVTLGCALALAGTFVAAQGTRPASPETKVSAEVGGQYVKGERGERYQGGKWIDITYGAPVLRGRTTIWGSGAEYGKTLLAGAPIWRAGANVSTRIKTEVPLVIGGKTVAPGEYTMFIDLKSPTDWTLVVSSWPAQTKYDPQNKEALWGGYNYTPDKDVARVAMKVDKLPMSLDALQWNFADVTATGGKLVIMWDTAVASAPFTIGK